MNMFKRLAKRSVNHFGYEIRRIGSGSSRRTMADVLANVAGLGFTPSVVIDVGVAKGTPALYNTFPDSYHLLIEPLEEFEEDIRSILKKYKGSYVIAAASSETGNIEINVHTDHLDGSSFYRETMGSEFDGVPRTVQAVRIDDLVKDRGQRTEDRSQKSEVRGQKSEVRGQKSEVRGQKTASGPEGPTPQREDRGNITGPYLIKVDVQGAELDVLDGAIETLNETELVITEVSMFQLMKNAPQFYDVVAYMKNLGFVVYDIFGESFRPLDGALGQIDMAFVKENGRFRREHSYATIEQWNKIAKH